MSEKHIKEMLESYERLETYRRLEMDTLALQLKLSNKKIELDEERNRLMGGLVAEIRRLRVTGIQP